MAVGLESGLIWLEAVLGPLIIDHAPVPTVGGFAPKAKLPIEQTDCGVPAIETVGGALTVMVTLLDEAAHGAFEIVHVNI